MITTQLDYDASLSPAERKRLGAWYTPPALVQWIVDRTLEGTLRHLSRGATIRVLDPACGDGRFLAAAARRIEECGGTAVLTGVDVDRGALSVARSALGEIELLEADALHLDWRGRTFDVVIGNPPFLSPLSSLTPRAGSSRFGGGTYADAAADFLALSMQLADRSHGRVGLVLPVSLLTARDAEPIRREVIAEASIADFWWSPTPVFDATVITCALAFQRGAATGRSGDPGNWGWLIADELGVPPVPALATEGTNDMQGTLGQHALATANFRDQYYGLVGHVSDDADGPPLITTGLIDVATCHWGTRPTRFAKQRFEAPRVDRTHLAPFMQRWMDRCLVPKVLLATQTAVLEAVVDSTGEWVPAVPVVRLVPHDLADLWRVAAVVTSPVASAIIAHQSVGSGMSPTTMRVSRRTLDALPWPTGDLSAAVTALRDGDIESCGLAVDNAYGVDDPTLATWWLQRAIVGWEPSATAR